MITLISSKNNKIEYFCVNINEYYMNMEQLISYKLKCSCGISGNCIKYGWYKRKIIINDKIETIKLQRVYCKHCKKTHTIMPRFIIPYEQQTFSYVLDLAIEYHKKDISKADYELARYVSIYKNWVNRLKSINISISDGLYKVITFCATHFKMCFMQSKMRNNIKLNKVEYYVIQLPTVNSKIKVTNKAHIIFTNYGR